MRVHVMKPTILLLFLVTVPLAWGAQTSQQTARGQVREPASKNGTYQKSGAPRDSSAYVIGRTDVLEVDVWKEPDVSRTVTVRPDGNISLPLVDDIRAAGLTPMELGAHITKALEKFINDPQVTVTVKAPNSQRVYVVGEVRRPGEITLLPNTTVLDALASAGGPSEFAHRKKIFILRTEGGKQVRYHFNYPAAIKGDLSQNIVLKPGDTVVVP